jgi:guanylate kinase
MSTLQADASKAGAVPPLEKLDENAPLGLLLVVSGPSGVGKDTVWQAAKAGLPTFAKAVTCTTRPRRPHEEEGVSYYFVSEEEFDRLIREDEMLEWAHVHDHRYGVPVSSVLDRLVEGRDVICVIDVQGAIRMRSLFPNSLLIFLKPPGENHEEELKRRMEQRGTTDQAELERRLRTAVWELSQIPLYDHQIVNDSVEHAARQLQEIVLQEKKRREAAQQDDE